MLYLVAYDIVDDNRRRRLFEALKDFGDPVQYSLFECRLDERGLGELLKRVDFEVDPNEDSFRVYRLCAECAGRGVEWGKPAPPPDRGFRIV